MYRENAKRRALAASGRSGEDWQQVNLWSAGRPDLLKLLQAVNWGMTAETVLAKKLW